MDTVKRRAKSHQVAAVMQRTGCDRPTAASLLQRHMSNVQAACDDYFRVSTWDFTLPPIAAPVSLASHLPPSKRREIGDTSDYGFSKSGQSLGADFGFSLRDLIGAIQQGEKCDVVRAYLTHFGETLGFDYLKDRIERPARRLSRHLLCHRHRHRGDGQSVGFLRRKPGSHLPRSPILGFAIARCQSFRKDMPMVVKTLLSLGWSVGAIPRAFYEALHRDLPDGGPPEDDLDDLDDDQKSWCVAPVRQRIAQALNFSFTIRYVLHLASRDEQLSGANKKLAQVHRASELLGIRYFLVGQTLASSLLTERFLTYLAMPIRQPLVLLFAGPSGHGKTELARNLGRLLSLDLYSVDCTNLSHESNLFGPWFPYQGWEKGSAVNNYLASHNGQRCVICMDEFEKTKDEVRRALLVPFQSGEYRNRRTPEMVNCSKTIWVLATNAFDQTIHEFCDNHRDEVFGDPGTKNAEEKIRRLGRQLTRRIQKESISVFGAPLTGRITDFIPFLPFSPIEQAAVADKYLTDLGQELSKPIDTCEEPARYRPVGNVDLQVKRGYSVCRALAEQGYVQKLGARSIINTIDREVMMPLSKEYLATREDIYEGQLSASFVVGVDAESGEVEVSQCALDIE